MICEWHKPIIRKIESVQREDKARRNLLNRNSAANVWELKVISARIRDRECCLLNANSGCGKSGCGMCVYFSFLRKERREELISPCLASSMVERPVCNREVVGSNPALGSISEVTVSMVR